MTVGVRGPILVAGAGALGSVVGGLLARAGWPVTLLGRAEHLDAVRRDGLAIEGIFGRHVIRSCALATSADELPAGFAAIFVTVKSWDTRAVAEAIASRLADDGWAIGMQNGLGNLETIAAAVGGRRTLGARAIFGAELVAPGRVRVTVIADPVTVGAACPEDERARAAASAWASRLDAAGVPARFTDDVQGDLWAKVLYNAALNPLGALLGVPYGYLADREDLRDVMNEVLDEAFAVAVRSGVRLPWPTASAYREVFYGRLVPSTAEHRPSMLQDLARGRPTEIDAINGWVAALGERLGVAVPVNRTLTRLIRARARRMREDGPS
jgi:2-dehydropantoate 2-reductase